MIFSVEILRAPWAMELMKPEIPPEPIVSEIHSCTMDDDFSSRLLMFGSQPASCLNQSPKPRLVTPVKVL